MVREFDNIRVCSLPELLREDRTLKRYYPLIPRAGDIARRLGDMGIADKYACLERMDAAPDAFASDAGLDADSARLLGAFWHLYDFRARPLGRLTRAGAALTAALAGMGVRDSGAYLHMALALGARGCADATGCGEPAVRDLFRLCDVMRLPGVSELRAGLFIDCGIAGVDDFAARDMAALRAEIARFTAEAGDPRSVPFAKELATQAAVARALPALAIPD